MQITQSIAIDLMSRGVAPQISAKQGDANSRTVRIALYSGGVSWEPGTGVTGVVQYHKPDGTGGAYDTVPGGSSGKAVTVSGSQLTVNLAPQVLTAAGLVLCQVQLLTGSTVLTTFAWYIDVEADVLSGVVSEDYYNVATLDGLSNRITALANQLTAAQAAISKAQQTASTAQTTANAARTTANAALPKTGGTMTGDINMGARHIAFQGAELYDERHGQGYRVATNNPATNGPAEVRVATPTDDESAANKQYVDNQVGQRVKTVNGQGPDTTGNVDVESGGVKTVSSRAPDETGNVALTAADVGALPDKGGTINGDITVNSVTARGVNATQEIVLADRGFGRVVLINDSEEGDPAVRLVAPQQQNGPVRVTSVAPPAAATDATSKKYVDQETAKLLPLTGGKMQGSLNMAGYDLLLDADKSTWVRAEKNAVYIGASGVDAVCIAKYGITMPKDKILSVDTLKFGDDDTGCSMYSEGRMNGAESKPKASFYGNFGDEAVEIGNVADPTAPLSAANKRYVDQALEAIETITVTEADVAVIERTQEPDGTPYRFSRIYITAYLPKPQASYQPRIWCMRDDIYLSGAGSTPGNIGTTNDMYATQICGIEHGVWMTYGIAPQQGAAWSGSLNTQIGYNPVMASDCPECNKVRIAKSNGTAWEIGTVIKIYGVRAV